MYLRPLPPSHLEACPLTALQRKPTYGRKTGGPTGHRIGNRIANKTTGTTVSLSASFHK